jgi:hypothetical protein
MTIYNILGITSLRAERILIRIQAEIRFLNYDNPQIPSGEEVEGGDY